MVAKWRTDPIRIPAMGDAAILRAIDATTAEAAIMAKQNHPTWRNRTGTLEGSIRFEPAVKIGATRYRGRFGSFDVNYAIFQEIGTRYIRAGYFLRNAADAVFPTVGARLRGAK